MRKEVLISLIVLFPVLAIAQSLEIRSDKKGRLGYFDSEGNKVISCQYEEAEPFTDGVARVCKNGKYGLINEKGKAIGGIKYTVMEEYADIDLYIVCEGGSEAKPKDKISTRTSIPFRAFRGSTSYSIKGAKWGLIDRQGNVVVKPMYDELSNPINGVIYVSKGGKFGFYNVDNMHLVLKPTYDFIGAFNNLDICWVKKGGKYSGGYVKGGKMSFVNREGKLIVPLKFENVSTFLPSEDPSNSSLPIHSGMALAETRITPFQPLPDSGEPYLWFASKGTTKPGIVDINGTILLPEKKYDIVYKPTDGMVQFAVTVGKKRNITTKWGFFNIETKKEMFTDAEYIFSAFEGGVSKAMRQDSSLYYFVNKDLTEISERYTWAGNFSEDYCAVGRGDKYGLVDRGGQEVISLEYDGIGTVSDGLLPVKKGEKWGYVTPDNQIRIPFAYDKVWTFKMGEAAVVIAGKIGRIDTKNNVILPIEWDDYIVSEKIPSNYYWVKKSGRYYYYDMGKRQLLYPEEGKGYDDVWLFQENEYAKVKSSMFYGAVYRDGTECVPTQFDKLEDVDKALFYLQKNNLTRFKKVDLKRFGIILRGTNNQYKLSDRIPEEDWDY